MKNVTITIDEETLAVGREYARTHHVSFSKMIRGLLGSTVMREPRTSWAYEFIISAEKAGKKSDGKKGRHEDLDHARLKSRKQ